MKSSGKPSRRKKAVGSIIGAVFLVLIILSGFTFYQLYLNIADHYNGTLQSMGESDWSRNREKIVIKNVEITGSGNLNVTVENDGTLQSHLIWCGIFNMSASPETKAYYLLDISVDPAETKSVVSVFTVAQGNKYAVQLVTEQGNTIGFKFYPASEVGCQLTLTTAPPTAYKGNNVTVALTVTHNDSEVDAIQSLTVSLSPTPSGLVQLMDNSSLTARGLRKGESAFFWWIYSTIGTGTVILNATYGQAPAGVYAVTSLTVLDSPGEGGAGTVSIAGVNGTGFYNPSQWNLLGSTQYVSGSVSDLASNDSGYAVFRSYYSGSTTDTNDAVDNNSSNVDGLGNKGTHSNFTATQYGPDGIMDTLTEANTAAGGNEQWVLPTGYDDPGNAWSLETNAYDNNTGTSASSSMDAGSWSQYLVLNHSALTCGKIRFYVGQSHVSVDQVQIDVYNSTWVTVYTGDGPWGAYTNVSFAEMSVSQMRFRFYNSHASQVRTAYVYEGHFLQSAPKQNYELDLEIQWTSVDYSQANEWLCIYGGTMGAENLRVDVWNGSAWNNIITALTSGWNNVSVSSYLTSSNFTIRFKGTTETGDIVQDSWNVDVAFLHLWTGSDQYTAEVEFTGSSNLQTWASLLWQIQSCWDIGQVTVTIQFYNFTLGNYSTSGNGYLGYVSSATPNTNELESHAEIPSPDDFKNATGHWRVRIGGVKLTSTQFLFKVDWVDFETTYSTTGSTIPCNVWQWYTIRATSASGGSIPYAYVSIYANGTLVYFRNATDKVDIGNPAWVRLDAGGQFMLEVKSASGSGETFVLYAVVGSTVGQKTVTQEAP
jgi:hypothetical protein